MRIGSLCSGYGGLDMAMEAYYNAETVWMSDLDKYASKVIAERWKLPNLGDLKTVDWASVEPIDILTAGYPCQPFSNVGQRKGLNDERHIWPFIKKIVSVLRPAKLILENVRGHLNLGFKEVLADITELGYNAKWSIVRASDVGAPHRRERLFVLAQPANTNGQRSVIRRANQEWNKGESQFEPSGGSKAATNASSEGLQGRSGKRFRYEQSSEMSMRRPPNPLDNDKLNPKFVEYMMGLPVGWVTDLDISRSQQLKLLGNGVVPQQAYYAIDKLERL